MAVNFTVFNVDALPHIRFLASPKLSFPESDILSYCEKTHTVELRFMGLLGVDSPLPYYLSCYAALLQLLSCYFYGLFFQALNKKYQFEGYRERFKDCKKYSRQNVLKIFQEKFKHIPIEITESVPEWVKLDSNSKTLGEMVVGQRVLVSRLRIIIPRNADHVVVGQWIMH